MSGLLKKIWKKERFNVICSNGGWCLEEAQRAVMFRQDQSFVTMITALTGLWLSPCTVYDWRLGWLSRQGRSASHGWNLR
jgi:hypothetical protein